MMRDWMFFDCLAPEWELTREQRREVSRKAAERTNARFPRTGIFAFCILAPLVLVALRESGVASSMMTALTMITCIAAGLAVPLGFVWFWKRAFPQEIRRALREAEVDVCMHCGHWLRGCDPATDTCPECGKIRVPLLPMEKAQGDRPH